MRRAALAQAELLVALAGVLVLGLLATEAAREHRRASRLEEQAAALETARNLLVRVRTGESVTAPAGWSIDRTRMTGAQRITVRGAGIELSTVVPP